VISAESATGRTLILAAPAGATLATGGPNMSTILRPVRDLRVIDAMHPGMI
jgi:hypothetical protein